MSTHGHQAGGIVGFMGALSTLVDLVKPRLTLIVWESGGSRRRRAVFPDYKKGRRPPKLNRFYEDIPDSQDNRMHQIQFLIEALKHVGVCQLYVEDCEADDVIGFISRNRFLDEKKTIASSDKDYYQLLNDDVSVYSWTSSSFIGPVDLRNKFKIDPSNFVLAKAIAGDPSDSIPGVKGVGFTSVAKRFDMLTPDRDTQSLLSECHDIIKSMKKPPKIYQQLIDNVELINRNRKLMYLDAANLAAVQVRKIDATLDGFRPVKNKLDLMRALVDEGLASFDVHSFFSAFQNI